MGNQWTTFFFIAMWLSLCGIPFLLVSVCLGLCLEELSTCLHVGRKFGRPKSVAIWKMVPIYIFWYVWKEINLRCFKDLESSMKDILASFFRTLYL